MNCIAIFCGRDLIRESEVNMRRSPFFFVRDLVSDCGTGCSGKKRDLQSPQRIASVRSLLFAGHFLYNKYQLSNGEGGMAKFWKILVEKKTQSFLNNLYIPLTSMY